MTRCSELRGFSLVEVLAVLAIIATLAALMFPVFTKSKREGYITADLDRLHQCQIATALYEHDNDGVAGIPPFSLPGIGDELRGNFYGTQPYRIGGGDQPSAVWASACGQHPLSPTINFVWFASTDAAAQAQYQAQGEHSMLLADENCNESDVDVRSDFVTKLGLGVMVDGTLVRRYHQGNVYTWQFWEELENE
jgi:prepilin-type N-terminal cleavage/methylation domain-containing protein